MTTVLLNIENQWTQMEANDNLIFVIVPGAGTFQNRQAYIPLEENYTVVYFGTSGGEYDKYPKNWYQNKNVSTTGKHLGGLYRVIEHYIIVNQQIPSLIICGSRGSQVTLGKVWENLWRGPSLIINAGCLTSQTIIPKGVTPYFVIMELDFFKRVNNIENTVALYRSLLEEGAPAKGAIFYLPGEAHMPNWKSEKKNQLFDFVTHILKNQPLVMNETFQMVPLTN